MSRTVVIVALCLFLVLQGICVESDKPNITTQTTTSTETFTTSVATPTTTAPSTTTVPITATTPTTTPNPDEPPKFVVGNGSNVCLILQAYMSLCVPYNDGKSDLFKTFTLNQPEIYVTGQCGNTDESLNLSWSPELSSQPFNLSLVFGKMPSSASNKDTSVLRSVRFEFFKSKAVFPGTKDEVVVTASANGSYFETPIDSGYTCTPQQNITLGQYGVIMSISSMHAEVFRNSNSTEFANKTMDCSATPSSNSAIPIAIGVTAAVLIVLAVVAFLIGNRRRAQGYQSL